jgi:hypothetical protein
MWHVYERKNLCMVLTGKLDERDRLEDAGVERGYP